MIMTMPGIIFPDILEMLVKCKIFNSDADFDLKVLQQFNPSLTRDKQIFRDIRDIEESSKKGKNSLSRTDERKKIRKSIREIKKILPFECDIKVKASDFRVVSDWIAFKYYFEYVNAPISNYVLNLCKIEKQCLYDIKKSSEHLTSLNIRLGLIKEMFNIPNTIFENIELADKSNDINLMKQTSIELKTSLDIHQYLHLAALFEHDLYGEEEKNNFNAIKRLLPHFDSKGKLITSVASLITVIYKKYKCKALDDFTKALSDKNIDQSDTIKTKLNRWKSGRSTFTPKDFNALICNPKNNLDIEEGLPEEIILIAIIFDRIYKESINLGMTQEWVMKEFEKYTYYQKIQFI